MNSVLDKKDYGQIIQNLKEKIRQTRLRAAFTVNAQLLQLYWEIGNTILQQQKQEGWGTKVIGRLVADLKSEFPDMKGLSERNIVYMQTFAGAYPDFSITQQPVAKLIRRKTITQQPVAELETGQFLQHPAAKLPWGHHVVVLDKLKTIEQRLFYIQKCAENSCSRSVLVLQIESQLHKRQGKAITNFERTLPQYQSDLAREMFKNPYLFDFLNIGEEAKERELEKALMQHLRKFLLELGRGFAYVGNQYNVAVGGDDFFFDLLFYNTRLHCYVVFELKVGAFKPEYAGKLNFYLSTVDAQLKTPEDKPTIGVLLCKTPNETTVEYALRGIDKPMGVADFELNNALPKNLKSEMPTIEELEAALESEAKKFKQPLPKKIKKVGPKQKTTAVTGKMATGKKRKDK